MTATEALVADLKLWACSPRVPMKAKLVMLEAIGRLSAPPEARRSTDVQEWLWHLDLHLTEHDLQHAGKALRAAWPHVSAYLTDVERERDTWRDLAKNAEAKLSSRSPRGTIP